MKILIKNTFTITFITIFFFLIILFAAMIIYHNIEQHSVINYNKGEIISNFQYQSPQNNLFKDIHKYNSFIQDGPFRKKSITANGKIEYDVNMHINQIGSRVDLFISKNAKKHFIIAGDSQTFGMGVEDEEVFSNLLNKEFDNYRVYNFGHMSWSPASTYLFFDPSLKENFNIKKYVKEESGIFFYLYFPILSERDEASSNVIRYTNGVLPYYKRVGDDLKFQGRFIDSFEYVDLRFFAFLGLDRFYDDKLRPIFLNKRKTKRERIKHSAFILRKIKERYLELYPASKFLVGICSINHYEHQEFTINEELENEGIKFIDMRSEDFCASQKEYFFSERHLNQKAHQKIKDILIQKITF